MDLLQTGRKGDRCMAVHEQCAIFFATFYCVEPLSTACAAFRHTNKIEKTSTSKINAFLQLIK
jgi:hypothetical protein